MMNQNGLISPTVFVARRLGREAVAGAQTIKTEINEGRWRSRLMSNERLAPLVTWIEGQAEFREQIQQATSSISAYISSFVAGSIRALTELFITLFALFFFFRDRRVILGALRSLVPLSNAETDLGGLVFWRLGLPAPLL